MSYTKLTVTDSKSRLSIKVRDSENHRPWWVYLDVDGDPLYLISNICDTCGVMLGRSTSLVQPLTPEQVGENLREGIADISPALLDTVANILPEGEYCVNFVEVAPTIGRPYVQPQERKNEKSPHYWWKGLTIEADQYRKLHEVILPVVSEEALDRSIIEAYKTRLQAGEKPTALALSMVDVRCLSGKAWDWHLLHFLLDGHHKMMAACELGMPITILSFLLKDWYFTRPIFLEDTLRLKY